MIRHPPSRSSSELCPTCGGPVSSVKCKQICQRCGVLVANCNGD